MIHLSFRRLMIYLLSLPLLLILLGQIQSANLAASLPDAGTIYLATKNGPIMLNLKSLLSKPSAPNACPALSGYPNTIERPNFCVYYTKATTQAQATAAADDVQAYWNLYVTNYGFLAPLVTGTKLEVRLPNLSPCNGDAWNNHIHVYTGCFTSNEERRHTIGHELFHRIQFHYDSKWANWTDISWMYEGTARMMEDNTFNDIDNWANSMTAAFSFNQEVNNYLASASNDLTSHPMRYMACLFWKYFSEQYGKTTGEPQLGVDAIRRLWEAVTTKRDISAVNSALTALGANTTFDAAFRRFAVANYTKDLTGLPNKSYNYVDEEQTGNPAVYGPVKPVNGGTITPSTSKTWNNQTVARYGIRYYQVSPASTCKVITASFHRDSGLDVFYHIVTQKGNAFAIHREGSGAD